MENEQESQANVYNRYKYIIENIKDIIWEMNTDLTFTFVSPNAKDMSGYEAEELLGQKMPDFLALDSRNYVYDQVTRHLNKRMDGDVGQMVLHEVQFVCKNGLIKWVEVSSKPLFEGGKFKGFVGTTRDITEKKEYERQLEEYIMELRTMNAKLEKMVTVDALTGANNRRKFDDDLNTIIKQKGMDGSSFSLIFFDIDRFKNINDRFGHTKGDYVLQNISRLVMENIRVTDGLFRWGGDEFIVILPEVNLESANNIAKKIKNIIQSHDFGIGLNITVSLGVGEYNPDENIDQIIVRVDDALLNAKSRGGNTVVTC